ERARRELLAVERGRRGGALLRERTSEAKEHAMLREIREENARRLGLVDDDEELGARGPRRVRHRRSLEVAPQPSQRREIVRRRERGVERLAHGREAG